MLHLLVALLFALLALPAQAHAVPLQLAHQGRLLDADLAPLDGSHDLTFRLYDAPEHGALLWEDTVSETFTGGYYSAVLGADDANPLDDGIFATAPIYLELTVDDGEPLLPRQEITSVPFALRAGTAENLEGGFVDASDVSIDGDLVIDEDGNWVGPTPSVAWEDLTGVPSALDTLGGLSCGDGSVAKYDGDTGLWACATDLVLSEPEVLDIVGGSVLDLGIGSTVDGGVIATLDDLDWSMLTGVPAGLADEEDADTLADLGLVCAAGDRAAWDSAGGEWVCASEVVGLDRIDTSGAAEGQVLTYDGGVGWEDPVGATDPPCTLVALNEDAGGALLDCDTTSLRLHARPGFTQVSAGGNHSCGLANSGESRCWGNNALGQSVPPLGSLSLVSSGYYVSCGLDSGGAAQCWGHNAYGQASPPAGTFSDISAGYHYACAIDSGGGASCWGLNNFGQTQAPAGMFVQISAGMEHACAVEATGTIQCWGLDNFGQATPPSGVFTQVSAGGTHTCGLLSTGGVECWGNADTGQSNPPAGTFAQISAGYDHNCGITGVGTLECWGKNNHGQSAPPGGTYTQVSAGDDHTCAVLETIGTATCWGLDSDAQASAP